MKRRYGLLVAVGIVVTGILSASLGFFVLLPRYIREQAVSEAESRGFELSAGELSFGWQWLQLSDSTIRLSGAPSISLAVGLISVELADWAPVSIELSKVKASATGSLPRVVLELGEWTKDHPQAFELPTVASAVSLEVAETQGAAPWLVVENGTLTRSAGSGVFAARSAKLGGLELGRVGAGFGTSGSSVVIGFGDQRTQAAPLELEAKLDGAGGKLTMTLEPVRLGLLGSSLGLALPDASFEGVTLSVRSELAFAATGMPSAANGDLHVTLQGYIPPHPPEIDGFVFGDRTTFDTKLTVDAQRSVVTLTESRVKAGRFELSGGGQIAQEGKDASIALDLRGQLPCDALAGAAAESRLGQLLGRASGSAGKRTARALIGGQVSVEVGIHTRLSELAQAKPLQKIGVGCGLRPLSLNELLALAPKRGELEKIGGELGRKLEGLGKELGLPPVPSALGLPALLPRPAASATPKPQSSSASQK